MFLTRANIRRNVVLGILASAALAGCAKDEGALAATEGILLKGNGAEPETLDPHLGRIIHIDEAGVGDVK